MKPKFQLAVMITLCAVVLMAGAGYAWAAAATKKPASAKSAPGLEAAKTLSMITGVAISPLLGVSGVGAYQWFKAPSEQRASLPWYAQPWFWGPALILVGLVAAKDVFGTAAPTALKKPFDVAETLENKVSGLVAAGAFVPLVVSVFPQASGTGTQALGAMGFAAIDAASIGNLLLVPFALIAFALVWLAGHAVNILILISPFTTVDAALKAFRLFLLSMVTVTSFANPYVGAVFCGIILVIAYFLAGWSFRLTVLGSVFLWDFFTLRRHRFQPGAERNWIFTARKIEGAPIRTYGRLKHAASGEITFEYRPWLFLKQRSFTLPQSKYYVGRGLFYPEIFREDGENSTTLFILSPRFRTHEEAVARAYGFGEVRDVGLLKGFKAGLAWLKDMFGVKSKPEQAAPVTVAG